MVPVLVKLRHSETQVIHCALRLLTPGFELAGSLLDNGETRVLTELRLEDAPLDNRLRFLEALLQSRIRLLETMLEEILLIGELLLNSSLVGGDFLDFLQKELSIRIHGAQTLGETCSGSGKEDPGRQMSPI